MLEITIPGIDTYDELRNEFITTKSTTIKLEHSLVSVSKWEARFHKPFLESENKTADEILEYIKFMTITQNVDPNVYLGLNEQLIKQICDYIADPMTATTFSNTLPEGSAPGGRKEIITSELIYYWMTALQIPAEYQRWHLNRLLTLIRVCNIKNQPEKKRSKSEIMNQHRALNEARRAAAGI